MKDHKKAALQIVLTQAARGKLGSITLKDILETGIATGREPDVWELLLTVGEFYGVNRDEHEQGLRKLIDVLKGLPDGKDE